MSFRALESDPIFMFFCFMKEIEINVKEVGWSPGS